MIRNFYIKKIKNQNRNSIKDFEKFIKISLISSLIVFSGFLYLTNFDRIEYHDDHDDKAVEVLLFIGDYFNKNPPEGNITIILPDIEVSSINKLASSGYPNLNKKSYDFLNNPNYNDFKNFFDKYKCDYIFVRKSDLGGNFLKDLDNDFDYIYENTDFIFAKLKN